jgi:hypothetical protein
VSARPIVLGAAAALAFAALWVGLTALTGNTYHLAPLVVAAVPGWMLRLWHEAAGQPLAEDAEAHAVGAVVATGVSAVALGWIAIAAGGSAPTATILSDQPAGVPGEIVFFMALGLFIAARNVARAACKRRPWAALRRARD